MNRIVLFILLAASFGIISCKSNPTATTSQPPVQAQRKVLIRSVDTGTLAVDGLLYLVNLHLAAEKSDSKDSLLLFDTTQMRVDIEGVNQLTGAGKEKRDAGPVEWKRDLKNYDFLVNVVRDYKEQTKTSFVAPLQIAVKETWKIEKVSDPSVTNTWNFEYMLNGGSDVTSFKKTAAEQTERVLVPARGPVLKEIRAFVEMK